MKPDLEKLHFPSDGPFPKKLLPPKAPGVPSKSPIEACEGSVCHSVLPVGFQEVQSVEFAIGLFGPFFAKSINGSMGV